MYISPYMTTVQTPATSKDMTLLATLKTELGITGSAEDAYLSLSIQEASAAIVRYLRFEVARETVVDSFRSDRCDPRSIEGLALSRTIKPTIASVVVDGVTLGSSEYEVDPGEMDPGGTGFLWRLDGAGSRVCWSGTLITVTYAAGYVMLTTLPQHYEKACRLLVKLWRASRTQNPLLKSEDVPGVASFAYGMPGGTGGEADLPPDVRALLPAPRVSIG